MMVDRRGLMAGGGGLLAAAVAGAPSQAAAPAPGGFDFLHGRWDVRHLKLRERLAGDRRWHSFAGTLEVDPILGGRGNFDRNLLDDPAGGYEAHSLRLFDAAKGLWSIWWLDSRSPVLEPPVVGRFEGALGTFFAEDVLRGRPIRVRTTYEALSRESAVWTQAFSGDGGATWEVNWIMDFQRAAA